MKRLENPIEAISCTVRDCGRERGCKQGLRTAWGAGRRIAAHDYVAIPPNEFSAYVTIFTNLCENTWDVNGCLRWSPTRLRCATARRARYRAPWCRDCGFCRGCVFCRDYGNFWRLSRRNCCLYTTPTSTVIHVLNCTGRIIFSTESGPGREVMH